MPAAVAAVCAANNAATRSEAMRLQAEADLRRQQGEDTPTAKKRTTAGDLAMEALQDPTDPIKLTWQFKEKKVIPGLEGLRASPPAESVKGKDGRIYQSTSIFCLRPGDEPRRSTIILVESRPFDPIILLTIICNCGTMAWESPLDPCCTDKADFIAVCEWVYLIIFTFEMFSKILAYGFALNDSAYLKDAWCQLDITVVTLAWLPILFPSFGNYSVIRSVRALRPLRALKRVPGMPVLVSSIMAAFPKMGNVAALCGFVFLVFGIVGMELFKGAMHNRCAYDGFEETGGHPVARRLAEGAALGLADGAARLVGRGGGALDAPALLGALVHPLRALKGGGGARGGGGPSATDLLNYTGNQADYDLGSFCTVGADMCPEGSSCAYFDLNPNYDIASFDSVPVAFIAILQTISFDTWTVAMYALMDAFSPLAFLFFILIVVFGGFFVVNLFLAVILQEFIQAQSMESAVAQEEERHEQIVSARRAASRPVSPEQACLPPDAPADERRVAVSVSPEPHADGRQPLLAAGAETSDGLTKGPDGSPGSGGTPSPVKRPPRTAPIVERGARASSKAKKAKGASCCDCPPGPSGWRRALFRMVTADWFGNLSTALVLVNMALMCMPYADMTEEYAANLETGATVISVIFMVEMTLKLLGMGCTAYWSDGWNKLDGSIVLMSVVDIVATIVAAGGANLSFLRILRMLRVLRMLRLMKSWKGLYKICMTFIKSIPQMSNLFVLMFLVMVIFSLLGMQLFGGCYNPGTGYYHTAEQLEENPLLEPQPRFHFDYFVPSMLTVFNLMTGSFYTPMTEHMHAAGWGVAAGYFVFAVLVGNYLIMNLFVAILLNAFADDSDETPSMAGSASSGSGRSSRSTNRSLTQEDFQSEFQDLPWPQNWSLGLFPPSSRVRVWSRAMARNKYFDYVIIFLIVFSSICLAVDSPRLDPSSDVAYWLEELNFYFTIIFTLELVFKVIAQGLIFGKRAYLKDPWNVLDFFIVWISVLVLLADGIPALKPLRQLRVLRVLRPLRLLARNEGMKLIITSLFKAMPAVGNVFGVVIAFMLVFSILGMQIFMGSFASCSDPSITLKELCFAPPPAPPALPPPDDGLWRRLLLDGGAAGGAGSPDGWRGAEGGDDDGAAAAPSALAALAAPAAAAASAAASAAAAPAWRAVAHVAEAAQRRRLKGGGGNGGALDGRVVWMNPPYGSFDDFASSMLTLYVMSTGDGWDMVMFSGMDASVPGAAPVRNDAAAISLFFVFWMFIGSFFALNLFVGVIIDNFNRIKAANDGSATMTAGQSQWVETMKTMSSQKAQRTQTAPTHRLGIAAFDLIRSTPFDIFITVVIIANVAVMACDYWGIEQSETNFGLYNGCMLVFSYIYYVEFVIKIVGLGPKQYFTDPWCQFDFFLVSTSLLDQFAADLLASVLPLPPMLLRVLRVFRVLRILRLLKGAKGVRNLLMTMVLSFPSLVNVCSLLALVIFMYSVLGVQLFTFVKLQQNLTEEVNFTTFANAFLLLFQCLTGDGWAGMMDDAMITPDRGCDPTAVDPDVPWMTPGDCGGAHAVAFFVSFQVLGSFVFLNLVVAVILENFSSLGNLNPDLVSAADIEIFKEVWASYDPDANQLIPVTDLPELLLRLPPPMGVAGQDHRKALRFCMTLNLTQVQGQVSFQDVMDGLVNNNFKSQLKEGIPPPEQSDKVEAVMKKREQGRRASMALCTRSIGAAEGPKSAKKRLTAEEIKAVEAEAAQSFARELVKLYVVRKRDYLRSLKGSDGTASFCRSARDRSARDRARSRELPDSGGYRSLESSLESVREGSEDELLGGGALAEHGAVAPPLAARRSPPGVGGGAPDHPAHTHQVQAAAALERRVDELERACVAGPSGDAPLTARTATIERLAEENRRLMAKLAALQAEGDAALRGEEQRQFEREEQRRRHYGVGDGRLANGGAYSVGTASSTPSPAKVTPVPPPTQTQKAAAATRMLSPRGGSPRATAASGVARGAPARVAPTVEPLMSSAPPPAQQRPATQDARADAAAKKPELTPMQRRASQRAAELRAEHRAYRSQLQSGAHAGSNPPSARRNGEGPRNGAAGGRASRPDAALKRELASLYDA